MLFSIIVPVYNVERYLDECIQSIVSQVKEMPEKCEVLLIDDGSTDNSGEICNQYKKQYPYIVKVIHQENQGLLLARRRGFREAMGEYIINCDSDDKLSDSCLKELLKIVFDCKPDVIFYNVIAIRADKQSEWSKDIFSREVCSMVEREQVLDNYLRSYKCVSMCCKTYRRKCINIDYDYGDFKGLNMGEDTLQSAEIYSNANTYVYLNKPLYYYRQATGMTSRFKEDYYFQFKSILKRIEEIENIAQIDEFEKKMAVKLFSIVGRSVTQGRKERAYGYYEEKKYLQSIIEDEMVIRYERFYKDIKSQLQWSHRVICGILLKRFYLGTWFMIKFSNVIS